ncbi:MAG: DUF3575 domain-containing protein [Bacteroidaceae bacterium]|nr:DUF3575 domain-containing protein [Bacteroidaceae bacterium]
MNEPTARHRAAQGGIKLGIMAILLAITLTAKGQTLAVKNNLLYDAALTPNIGLELRTAPHWTLGINAGYMPWPQHSARRTKWKHLLVAPEMRYWFCETFSGHFLGFNAVYSHYNAGHLHLPLGLYPTIKDKRKQGDLVAAGLFWGYSWILSPHWSFEAEAGVDVGYTWYKNYECAHCGTYLGKDDKSFVMPKLGLNVIYNIK